MTGVLFVVAGHGQGDPGACGNGYSEAERVRTLARKIKEIGGSNVVLGDMDIDYYKQNAWSWGWIPDGAQCVELHMDSAASSASGGHVIIPAGLNSDDFDNKLADFISKMFPGRSNKIVSRSDLQNPNAAKARGINYRLLECCFISNAKDVQKFNADMDSLATGIIQAAGLSAQPQEIKGNIVLWAPNGMDNQRWLLWETDKDDFYKIQSHANGKFWTVINSDAIPGRDIAYWPEHKNESLDSQLFKFEEHYTVNGFQFFHIRPKLDLDLVLGITGASQSLTSLDARLQVENYNNMDSQRFGIIQTGGLEIDKSTWKPLNTIINYSSMGALTARL